MALELDNTTFVAQRKALEAALVSHKETDKIIRKIITDELRKARNRVSQDAKAVLPLDPRDAYKAVRNSVYKKILGGQINILQPKRAGNRVAYHKVRKLDRNPYQRGGNRIKPSQRTIELDSYYGKDRGFVLRFLNDGTAQRTSRYGNRGSIAARRWFANSGNKHMEQAAETIAQLIDATINEILNK